MFLCRRLGLSLLALAVVSSFSFFLIHLVPGDPVDLILGDMAAPLDREQLQRELGLDQSVWVQYRAFLRDLAKADLGRSLHSQKPVLSELLTALPPTFSLAFLAMLLAGLWSLPLSFLCVIKRGFWDKSLSLISLLLMSLPVFFLAPLMIWFFSLKLAWLPVSGSGEWGGRYLILPACSLALPLGAVLMKMSRASLLEVCYKDYVRTAQAKGVGAFHLYLKHIFKNALIPIVTILGLQSTALLTGTVIVESIFDLPGVGLLLLKAIQQRDYPLVQGAILFIASVYVLGQLVIDLVYFSIHPKMQGALNS